VGMAWGPAGHRVIALIAAQGLTLKTRQQLVALLNTTEAKLAATMGEASIWPDTIDKRTTGTGTWHFMSLPIAEPFPARAACLAHDCLLDKIEDFATRLGNNIPFPAIRVPAVLQPPRTSTFQELAFLIHLIGDLHQPLHVVTNGDAGGLCVHLRNPTQRPGTLNLHELWDEDEVLAVLRKYGNDETRTANALFAQSRTAAAVISGGKPIDWAREVYEVGRTIYQRVNLPVRGNAPDICTPDSPSITINQSYIEMSALDATQLLTRAGLRLSRMLNDLCASGGCQFSGLEAKYTTRGR